MKWFLNLRMSGKLAASFGSLLTLTVCIGALALLRPEARVLMVAMVGLAVIVGVALTVVVGRAVSVPLTRASEVFQRISAGDLDNVIVATTQDETGQLLSRLADMQNHLRTLVAENKGQLDGISKVQAVIEFQMDGTILTANDIFLSVMGYSLEEIRGRHHSMFADSQYAQTEDYRRFWEKLRRGEHDRARYERVAKGGRRVWLDAIYNPIRGADGKPLKVVKYASDITAQVHLTNQMERAVAQTQTVIAAAAAGDLAARLDARDLTGDLARMAESINSLLGNMAGVVQRVKAAASEVHRGVEEMSQGNEDLSRRTEQQSSSLEETASSMEEMTTTTQQNADNASAAKQLAVAAREQAEQGGTVVGEAVHAMTAINESSRRIADIIGVIDGIAFQTNLLALNAAVEAARAGEQGRGFAVVAAEVRSLAGRSAVAAREIKDLIQDSVRKVESGSQLVEKSGQTLGQIVVAVKKVSDIVSEIAASSREQSSGINQVSKAVMQMDEMTQQNAALVEQAAAASIAISGQARDLNKMMGQFRLGVVDSQAVADLQILEQAAPEVTRIGPRPTERTVAARPARRKVAAAGGGAPVAADKSEWDEF